MNLKLETTNSSHMTEFILNPFAKATKYNHYIMQKYSKTSVIDVIYGINKKSNFCDIVCYVNYQLGKVFIIKKKPLMDLDLKKEPFVMLSEAKENLTKTVLEMIKSAKVNRMAEIEEDDNYGKFYYFYKTKVFKDMVFSLLGTQPYEVFFKSSTDFDVAKFCECLSVEKLMKIFGGDLSDLNAFVEKTIFSEMFMITDIILEKLQKEAEEYVKEGDFTKEELILIDFLEKTKASGAKRFTVHMTSGRKLKCINEVSCEGKVYEIGESYYRVNFIDIKKVEYRGKVIYERDC